MLSKMKVSDARQPVSVARGVLTPQESKFIELERNVELESQPRVMILFGTFDSEVIKASTGRKKADSTRESWISNIQYNTIISFINA